MSVRTRILLVDDHFVVRSGLAASLGLESDFEVTAEADSVLGALEICSREQFDVVLLDLQLPDGSGLDAIEPILNCQKEAAVLLFSTFVRVDEIDRAMTAGASGFVAKSVDRDDLIRAIRAAVAGREVLSDDLTDQLRVLRSGPAITERERDILALVAKGRANKEIGGELGIAEDTVKRHISNVLQKFGVSDRAEATAEAIRRGIIEV